jgi:hypothetical protein
MLVHVHGLNLFLAAMTHISKGQFDVAPYLLRAVFDCQSLALAVGLRDDMALRFLEHKEIRASEARQLAVDVVRTHSSELAESINSNYKQEFQAANELSHLGLRHIDKLLEVRDGILYPIVGGRPDGSEAVVLTRAVLLSEHMLLAWTKAFHEGLLGDDWLCRFESTTPRLTAWLDSTKQTT